MNSLAFQVAHIIKGIFSSFSKALKLAWAIVKAHNNREVTIKFAKSCGEVREAIMQYASIDTLAKGYVRFVELLPSGDTQWRSFRMERVIF